MIPCSSAWDLIVSPHLSESLRIPCSQSRYDGIIARVTPKWARRVKEAHIPLVNILLQTTVEDVPTVVPDRRASGVLGPSTTPGAGRVPRPTIWA